MDFRNPRDKTLDVAGLVLITVITIVAFKPLIRLLHQ